MISNNRKVKLIKTNWFYTNDGGEDYYLFEVGKSGVKEIKHLYPNNGLERDFCVVEYDNGITVNHYNVNLIEFYSEANII